MGPRTRRQRRVPQPVENHDRWLISYADFITLLFAFFVVMYSLSTFSEGSYRVLSDSIVNAFGRPLMALDPVQIGKPVRTPERLLEAPDAVSARPRLYPLRPGVGAGPAGAGAGDPALERVAEGVQARADLLLAGDVVDVRRDALWVEIELKAEVLFPSGSRVLLAGAVPVLEAFAEIFRDLPNPIRVEGFTDNVPIANGRFPSNWELSAARAARVVRLFEASGVAPARLSATGFGAQRPVASNATPEGRARNRRVLLVVMSTAPGAEAERMRVAAR